MPNVEQFAVQSPGIIKCPVCWKSLYSENLQVAQKTRKSSFEVNAFEATDTNKSASVEDDSESAVNQYLNNLDENDTSPRDSMNGSNGDSFSNQIESASTQRIWLQEPEAFTSDGSVKPASGLYCKECGQVIPRDYLMRQSFPVSLVGISNSGKTSFLASMTERFTRVEIPDRLDLSCVSIDGGEAYNSRLLSAHKSFQTKGNSIAIPEQTDEEVLVSYNDQKRVKPYIFKAGVNHGKDDDNVEKIFWNLTSHLQKEAPVPSVEDDINVVFHDILGGYFEKTIENDNNTVMDYLNASNNSYLIFYDPGTNSSIVELHNNNLTGTDKDELAMISQNDLERQNGALNLLRPGSIRNATEIIVLVTKFDKFKRLFVDFIKSTADNRISSTPFEDALSFGKLFQYSSLGIDKSLVKNRAFISKISNYLKRFLSQGNGNPFFTRIRQFEEERDKEILCLPISSLGSEAMKGEELTPFIRSFRPVWVELVFCLIWEAIKEKRKNMV